MDVKVQPFQNSITVTNYFIEFFIMQTRMFITSVITAFGEMHDFFMQSLMEQIDSMLSDFM